MEPKTTQSLSISICDDVCYLLELSRLIQLAISSLEEVVPDSHSEKILLLDLIHASIDCHLGELERNAERLRQLLNQN